MKIFKILYPNKIRILTCYSKLFNFGFQQKLCQEELEKWKILEKEAQEKLDNESKDLTKVSSKQNILRQKLDECQTKISDLGALPNTELITKFMSYSSKNVSLSIYCMLLIIF